MQPPLHAFWISIQFFFVSYFLQVDLRHIDEENNRAEVEIGVDLTEFYMSVEWDILEVPAIRNVKYYTCCDEPYLDITFNVTMRLVHIFIKINFCTVLHFFLFLSGFAIVEIQASWTL